MKKFKTFSGIAAPLPITNCDTDVIYPGRYLRTIERTGLGKLAFADLRYDEAGAERSDFVLNQQGYRDARILVAGENFGCGSSREHAAWALVDFGIRVVIAPSFADIFYGNALNNGLLPIALPKEQVDTLLIDARRAASLTVDLENQAIVRDNRAKLSFDIEPFKRQCLIEGLDEIGLTLRHTDTIEAFAIRRASERPWLYGKTFI